MVIRKKKTWEMSFNCLAGVISSGQREWIASNPERKYKTIEIERGFKVQSKSKRLVNFRHLIEFDGINNKICLRRD